MPRALTDDEKEAFEGIRNAPNITLVQTTFNGAETAVIASVNDDKMHPLAVLVTDEMFDMIANPFEGE